MGTGSCENSVIVEEPLCVPISGQHLCSEFTLISVPEQQSCSKLSHPVMESNSELASTANVCQEPVADSGSSCWSSGDSTQMCTISRDGSMAEHEYVGALVSENLLENDSVLSGGCLDQNYIGIGICEIGSGGECLQEGNSEGQGGSGNIIGDCELLLEDIPVASLASGDCLNENNSDVDGCRTERAGECFQESRPWAKDNVGNQTGNHELPLEVIPVAGLVSGVCLNENQSDIGACSRERAGECSKESRSEGGDGIRNLIGSSELPLEYIAMAGLANGDCLNENHRDIDTCSTERAGECLQEGRTEGEGCSGNLASGSCTSENQSDIDGCGIEYAGECLQESKPQGEDDAGNLIGDWQLPLEVIPVAGLATEGCLNGNLSDIDACNPESCRECLQESRPNGKEGLGDLKGVCELPSEVIPTAGLASGGCLNEKQSNVDASYGERGGECLQESRQQGEDGLGNLPGNRDLPLDVIPVGIQQDEQKDGKAFDYLHVEDTKEVVEDKDNVSAIVNNDLCEQDPSFQDCESSELVPMNGVLGNVHEQKEQDFKNVDGSSSGDIREKIVASIELEADLCKKLSPLLHSGEVVSNCDWNVDQNDCTGGLSKAFGVGSDIDASNQASILRSLENSSKYESPSIYVQEYEQNEKRIHIPSIKGGTEFVEEKNDVSGDTKVEVGGLEENACNKKHVSPRSSQYLGVTDDGSSKRLDVVDQLDNSSQDPVKSSGLVDCFGQTDNQGNDNDRLKCVSEAKCCEIVSSSSQRNGRRSRSNSKTQTKKATRKCKKTAKAVCPNGKIKIAFKVTKKRSSLPNTARSSAWGLLANVTQLFEHSNGLEPIQVSNKGSQKSKGCKNNGNKNKDGSTARAQGLEQKCHASNTSLRLKLKIGKRVNQSFASVTVPELFDPSASSTAISCEYGTELRKESPKVADGKVDDWEKGVVSVHSKCFSSHQDKVTSYPGASVREAQLVNNDSDSNVVTEKLAEDSRDDYFGTSNILVDASGAESRCKDPGTSPDSEVINLIPDAHTDSRPHDDFHGTVTSCEDPTAPGGHTSNNRGKKKNKHSGSASSKLKLHPVKTTRAKPLKQYGRKQNRKNGIHAGENHNLSVSANASSNSSSDKEPSVVNPTLVSENVLRHSTEALIVETGAEANKIDCDLDTGAGLSKRENSKKSKARGHKIPKCKSHGSDSGIKRVNARCKSDPKPRSVGKKKTNKKRVGDQVACNVEIQPEAENYMIDSKEKTNTTDKIASTNVPNLDPLPGALCERYIPPRNAWVRCDGCHKWRRIAAELADLIEETKCTWTCKDNINKAFADCSTPQEKSNADINAELEISDASGEEDPSGTRLTNKGLECMRPRDRQDSVTCTTIRTNQFLHRNRKTQTIDEIMVCHCKPPTDGRLGCGDDCLNRMLNIECVQGACPCGELCSNQQFQKRKYAKLGKFHCGKKGYGLKLLEDIPKGNFLIEYVGEVLDMQAYEARQKEYAIKGHKHFYFMTLNCNEVIDACVKGNKGRFINHSCDPNCQTEKWMVNGEICIGLFALRDIKKGEEVTFDYNYVRVFGAAAKKCYCLSQQCRGYIGGDPLSGDVIIQSDSDEDYPEPWMLHQGSGERKMSGVRFSVDDLKQTAESILEDGKDKGPLAFGQSETSTGKEDSISQSVSTVSPVHDVLEPSLKEKLSPSVLPLEISQETEDSTSELMSTVQQGSSMAEDTPVKELSKSLSDGAYANRKSKSDTVHERKLSSKGHANVKISRSSSSVKKAKVKNSPPSISKVQLAANKSEVLHVKPKKVIEGSFGSHFEAVEEKLNELLDPDGGISKRKDAAKGYLKLLFLTAASGSTANTIQRNRDLSMILDALLKTRSRVVLVDIINKNGLRMLHKIINQYRRDFKKIPILRKLLKVLEYLAVRGILTLEHIKEGPPYPGMESFRESFLSLTEHEDKQVHQIARSFRDRWIPKYLRRPCFMDRDDNKTEFPRSLNYNRFSPTRNNESDHAGSNSEATDCVKQSTPATPSDAGIQEGTSASCVGVSQTSGTRTRKRKSRWDQPAETILDLSSLQHKEQKAEHKPFETSSLPVTNELSVDNKDEFNREDNNSGVVNNFCQLERADIAHDGKNDILDDVPPGFSSPLKPALGSSVAPSTIFHLNCPADTVIGHPQEKFFSRLPVSYGIPVSIMQQFGTPREETAGSWVVAPGMPFHPFPPLPPFPRDKKDYPPSCDASHSSVNKPAEGAVQDCRLPAANNLSDCSPSTTGDQPAVQIPPTNNHYSSKRGRESHDLGRRYFKQQKWNNTKLLPPWHWSRNAWGCGGNPRGETNGVSVGNVNNELRSTYCSEDLSYQQPEHQSQP